MPTDSAAAFATWTIPFWATVSLLVTAAIYIRGWRQIRLTRPGQFPEWRLLCFLAGLLTVWVAIASPLDSLANLLLVAHMTQHLLLMSVAPPLVALGAPVVPLLRGLPRSWIRDGIGPFFTLAPVHAIERLLKSRLFCWFAMNFAFLAWHVPAAYDMALAHPQLHEVEHACFLLTSLLFWWPIIEPWPVVYKGSRWLLLPYLMSADLVNTALSAFLSFSGRIIYPAYADAPRLFGITALNDQVAAGSLMWVLGSTAFLVPIMGITARLVSRRGERRAAARNARATALRQQAELNRLFDLPGEDPGTRPSAAGFPGGARSGRSPARAGHSGPTGLADYFGFEGHPERSQASAFNRTFQAGVAPMPAGGRSRTTRFDLLKLPAVGAFLKSRYGRQSLQAVMLLASAAIIVDGFFGHPMASMNLAGIIPWTYARALFVLALLLVGNLFCMSCPFMLPRELAKKLASSLGLARLPWPRALRNKWLSATLLGLFFWAYEAFALWDSPARTASLLVAYFLTAITIDSIFRGASFCKYVCPLGQFNFVSSLLSPVELGARSQSTCSSCSTRDCIAGARSPAAAGSPSGRITQRGCELDLFMPRKSGNLDCTLCMDCVKACPHDNIGLFVYPPAHELVQLASADPQRSSVGRYSRRPDVAFLALLVVSAAFASAAVMVTPVVSWLSRLTAAVPGWLAPSAGLALAAAAPLLLFLFLLSSVLAMRPRVESRTSAAQLAQGRSQLLQRRTEPAQERSPTLQERSHTLHDPAQPQRGPADTNLRAQLCRWTLALLPLGLGMWAAHLVFHLAAGWNSLVPALQQAAVDLHSRTGLLSAARPDWAVEHSLLAPDSLLQLQLLVLNAGLLAALYLGWQLVVTAPRGGQTAGASGGQTAGKGEGQTADQKRVTTAHTLPPPILRSLATLAPWAALVVLLYSAGVWVLIEPMQMRGMMGM